MGRMMLFAVFAVCLPAAVTTATVADVRKESWSWQAAASFVSPPSRAAGWRGIARCVTGHTVRTELRLTEWCQKRRSQCTLSHCVSHTGWTAKQTPHGDQVAVSRRRLAIGSSLSISAFLCGVVPDAARAATSIRSLKRALVNIIRVREGSALLHRRLEDNLLGGFQDGVKLLAADTEIFKNVKIACQGLVELQLQSSVANVCTLDALCVPCILACRQLLYNTCVCFYCGSCFFWPFSSFKLTTGCLSPHMERGRQK
jgi:hypothetical protein